VPSGQIHRRSARELAIMREAGRIVAETFGEVAKVMRPGVSTRELDKVVEAAIRRRGGEPLFKGYRGFPAASCISINEEVVHGIPRKGRILREGDVVSVDLGVRYKGYCGDAAVTFAVGSISAEAERLLRVCRQALYRGIEAARPGNRLSAIGGAIQTVAEQAGFGVVRRFVGHGIGTTLHEAPQVPNYVDDEVLKHDIELQSGMVLAIEPMLTEGTYEVEDQPDNWTIVTADRRLAAHYEHTVAIREEGPEILTPWEEEIDRAGASGNIGLFKQTESHAEGRANTG